MARLTCKHRQPVGAGFARERLTILMFAGEARSYRWLHMAGSAT